MDDANKIAVLVEDVKHHRSIFLQAVWRLLLSTLDPTFSTFFMNTEASVWQCVSGVNYSSHT